MRAKRLDTYSASISDPYNFIVAFLITVPFPARCIGFSLLVTKIISLKIRLNAGASLLASSTSCLANKIEFHITLRKEKETDTTYHILFLSSATCLSSVTSIVYSGLGSTSTPVWLRPRPNMQTPESMGLALITASIGAGTVFSPEE